jgi:hypothetical protein
MIEQRLAELGKFFRPAHQLPMTAETNIVRRRDLCVFDLFSFLGMIE